MEESPQRPVRAEAPSINNEESSLDLHLDISLPAIVQSPDKAAVAQSKIMASESPAGKQSVLMSDERELLKDLECFEEASSAGQRGSASKPIQTSAQKSNSGENLTVFEETRLAAVPENLTSTQKNSLQEQPHQQPLPQVNEVAYDSVGSGQQAQRQLTNAKQLCLQHGKQIEAFCLFDRQLLCIDCILSDVHRAKSGRERHDMVSVDQAAESERESLQTKFKQSEEAAVGLKEQNTRIERQLTLIQSQAETQIDETKQLFKEIKQALNKKEEDMIKNIQALLTREQGLLQTRKQNNASRIKNLSEFREQYEESKDEENIVMLSKSQKRHQTIDKGISRISKLQFNRVFTEFRKDIELYSIAKTVQALSKQKQSPMKASEHSSSMVVNTSAEERQGPPNVAFGRTSSSQIQARSSQAPSNLNSSASGAQNTTTTAPSSVNNNSGNHNASANTGLKRRENSAIRGANATTAERQPLAYAKPTKASQIREQSRSRRQDTNQQPTQPASKPSRHGYDSNNQERPGTGRQIQRQGSSFNTMSAAPSGASSSRYMRKQSPQSRSGQTPEQSAQMPPKPTTAGSSRDLIHQLNPSVNLERNNPGSRTSAQLRSDIPKYQQSSQRKSGSTLTKNSSQPSQTPISQSSKATGQPSQTPISQSSKVPVSQSNANLPATTPLHQSSKAPIENFSVRANKIKTVHSNSKKEPITNQEPKQIKAKNVDRISHLKQQNADDSVELSRIPWRPHTNVRSSQHASANASASVYNQGAPQAQSQQQLPSNIHQRPQTQSYAQPHQAQQQQQPIMSLAQLRQQKKTEKQQRETRDASENQDSGGLTTAQQIVKTQKDNLDNILNMIRADSQNARERMRSSQAATNGLKEQLAQVSQQATQLGTNLRSRPESTSLQQSQVQRPQPQESLKTQSQSSAISNQFFQNEHITIPVNGSKPINTLDHGEAEKGIDQLNQARRRLFMTSKHNPASPQQKPPGMSHPLANPLAASQRILPSAEAMSLNLDKIHSSGFAEQVCQSDRLPIGLQDSASPRQQLHTKSNSLHDLQKQLQMSAHQNSQPQNQRQKRSQFLNSFQNQQPSAEAQSNASIFHVEKQLKPRTMANLDESGSDAIMPVSVQAPQPIQQTFESDLMSLYYDMHTQKPMGNGSQTNVRKIDEKEQR